MEGTLSEKKMGTRCDSVGQEQGPYNLWAEYMSALTHVFMLYYVRRVQWCGVSEKDTL